MKQKNKPYKGKLICKICGKEFEHLGSHVWHKHKIKAKEYKKMFELPYNEALISTDIYLKKKEAWEERKNHYLKNLKKGKKHQFKKDRNGQRRISKSERKRFIKRIKGVNKNRKLELCPICKVKYYNLDSHLFNKHNLLRIKKGDKE